MATRYDEDGRKIEDASHLFGQDLSQLSVSELRERIAMMKEEILRLEQEIEGKNGSIDAANSFFKS